MQYKKLLTSVLSAAMVLATMVVPAFADDSSISSQEEFENALNNLADGDKLMLAGGEYTVPETVISIDKSITIEGEGKDTTTLKVNKPINVTTDSFKLVNLNIDGNAIHAFNNDRIINLSVKNVDIENIDFSGGGQNTYGANIALSLKDGGMANFRECKFSNAFRGVQVWEMKNSTVEFDDCTFNPQCYTLNIDGKQPGGILVVKNSVMSGWTSFDVIEKAVFEGVTFEKMNGGYGYNFVKPYTDTYFDECDFNDGAEVEMEESHGDKTLAITNSRIDGEPVDSSNISNLFSSDSSVKADGVMIPVAKNGLSYYSNLADAAAAAQDGDTVTLLADAETSGFDHSKAITFDLNNNTLKFNEETVQNNVTADVGFKNGTIDISGIDIKTNAFWQVFGSGALNFEDVNLYGDTFNSAYCVIYFVGTEAKASFKNSIVNLSNDGKDSGFIKGDNFMGKAVFDNTDITLTNTGRGFVTTDVTLKNGSDLTVSGTKDKGIENAFNRCALTVLDSNIDISGCTEYGIKLENHDVEIKGESNVSVTDSGIADIAHADETNPSGKVTVEENSTVTAENIGESVLSTATGDGKIISKADTISVKFKQTTNPNVYDIALEGANLETINRLSTADFTFEFDVKEGKMAYAIASKDGVTLTNPSENRYAFNFNGKDAADETGKEIVLGTVTFNGYGTFSFGVADAATNIVHAAKLADNIVDEFVVGGGEGKGTLNVSASLDDVTLTVPTNKLTVNITFPNAIGSNDADYQKMKATIAGGDHSEEIALGTMTDGAYKIEKDLVENTPYTVTVSGEGYRTTRYTVTLNSDKILNFWNNVKDNAAEVEAGNPASAKNVTFLAGDIVKDNEINIYDLSAVVSYFGMDNLVSAHPEYAKYDLNRDGKIDSKDVAYVLVSWGK